MVLFIFPVYPQKQEGSCGAVISSARPAAAAVVKGTLCSSTKDPCLKIGGGVKREERGERAEWYQVSAAVLQGGKRRFHYSVV